MNNSIKPGRDGDRFSAGSSPIQGYRLFRILGFDIKLNITWLLLALLITWTLAEGFFPTDYPGLAVSLYWWMGVAGAVGILFSIVLHELSHSLVARSLGLPIRGITLFIFGGIAEMEEEPVNPKVEFLMAVAGPLMSLLLAFVMFLLEKLAIRLDLPLAIIGVSHYLATVNLIFAVFNMVPAFPLDGGRIMRAALWHWLDDLRRATWIASRFGTGFGLVLMIFGGLAFIQGNFIGGMWYVLIGAFLRGAASAAFQQVLVREFLGDRPVRDFMQTDPITVPPDMLIHDWVENYLYLYHFRMFPVVENSRLLGCITTRDLKAVPREQWRVMRVRDLTSPCSAANTVSSDTSVARLASDAVRPDNNSRFMVVENDRLVGVISLRDLREYIALKMEISAPPCRCRDREPAMMAAWLLPAVATGQSLEWVPPTWDFSYACWQRRQRLAVG